jgi:putative oligomerization/nucleic acid binding protein/phospholipase D-like protein
MEMPLATFTFGDALLSILEIGFLILWIWVAITVVADIFRSHDLSNWAKALWILFIIVFPLIGVFGYLLIRGHKLHEHQAEDRAQYEAFRAFTHRDGSGAAGAQAGGGAAGSHADDLQKLADLKDRGVLSDEEFERAKAKVLG